jgi:hypothetical protein
LTALTLRALLEPQMRQAMQARAIRSIPLYLEKRACRAPTTDELFALFENHHRHRLFEHGHPVETFWDELTDVQCLVLELSEISPSACGR